MKQHYEKVMRDIESRLAVTKEALDLLDKEHEQLAAKRVHLQSDRGIMESVLYDLEHICYNAGYLRAPTPEPEWEFFQEGTDYFWAYPKDGVEGLFYVRGNPSWVDSAQTKDETIRYSDSAQRITNLPPGIPMP
jgi:hypothetical protein